MHQQRCALIPIIRVIGVAALTVTGCIALAARPAVAQTSTVPFYHGTADHAGMFVVPGLTAANVASTVIDSGFNGQVSGVLNAAPLYWHPSGTAHGTVIVATDSNVVVALDEVSGKPVWQTTLGTPASRGNNCGNIDPVGVTGTPVIDAASGSLYLDAVISAGKNTGKHMIYGLSLTSGAVLPGWPVAVGAGLSALGKSFNDDLEEQRGALALVSGTVFVPYGGYIGDCGAYHGIVAGVSTASHAVTAAIVTRAEKGGIWAPGGVVADSTSVYFATGNTAQVNTWGGGEAIIHAGIDLKLPSSANSYFSPSNWMHLDNDDYDLGGTAPTLIDLPGSSPSALLLGLGKDGNAYLLNRTALGGIGAALQTVAVAKTNLHAATARYTLGGAAMVAVTGTGLGCPAGIIALKVAPGAPPSVSRAWCTGFNGRGEAVVTTSDGINDPIVWVAGAEGDEKLHAFDGSTGKELFTGPAASSTIAHFSTLLVANGRLFVPAAGRVIAFDLPTH